MVKKDQAPAGPSSSHRSRRFSSREKIAASDGRFSIDREAALFTGFAPMHGVQRIYASRGIYTYFWVSLLAFAVCMLIWQTYDTIRRYTQNDTYTQLSVVIPNGLDLPSITICNLSPIRESMLEAFNESSDFSTDHLNYMRLALEEFDTLLESNKDGKLNLDDLHAKYIQYNSKHNNLLNPRSFYNKTGSKIEGAFLRCSFAGRHIRCTEYFEDVLTGLGRCQRYNGTLKQLFPGVNGGLQLLMTTSPCDKSVDGKQPEIKQKEDGFRVVIGNNAFGVYQPMEPVTVGSKSRVYISMSQKRYEFLNQREGGKCTDTWPAGIKFNLSHQTGKIPPYNSAACRTKCFAMEMNATCGCVPLSLDLFDEYTTCDTLALYNCLKKNFFDKDSNSAVFPTCTECAHVECEYNETLTTSSNVKVEPVNDAWSGLTMINIFYRDLAYQKQKQKIGMTLSETFGNIGGIMGMYLGMSIFSIFEAFIFLGKIIWIALSSKRRAYLAEKQRVEVEAESVQRHSRLRCSCSSQNTPLPSPGISCTPASRISWLQEPSFKDSGIVASSCETFSIASGHGADCYLHRRRRSQ